MCSHLTVLFVSTIFWATVDSTSANSPNQNCTIDLRNLTKEYDHLKLDSEREAKELRDQLAQFKNEIESLKLSLVQSQQSFSACTNSVFVLTKQIEVFKEDKGFQNATKISLDSILQATQRIEARQMNKSNPAEISKTRENENLNTSSPQKNPKDCAEIRRSGRTESGVYNIYAAEASLVQVYCDMDTDGGGWTVVLQRNKRGTYREDFYRNWTQYEIGFGDVASGDYNIGLKNLYALTSTHDQHVRVDLSDFQGNTSFANYKTFWIGGTKDKYKLTVGDYSGTAGDSLGWHNGQKFSTFDEDNDSWSSVNCAVERIGAWWYMHCHHSNLNGKYYNEEKEDRSGINWYTWKNEHVTLKSAEMKIRPANFDAILKSLV